MASAPNLDSFPAELKAQRRWVTWRYVTRRSKITKPPLQSITKPEEWLTASIACDCVDRAEADGAGFVLGGGLVGVDLDACIDNNGELHEMALDALALGTYAELSPSGRGLHVFIRATVEKPRKIGARGGVPGRELYDGRKGSSRFFTVTGKRVGSATQIAHGPQAQAALDTFMAKWFRGEVKLVELNDNSDGKEEALDDDRVLRVMFGAKDGARWRAVFQGDYSRYPSQSEADLALCGKLRFFTHANSAQIDRLFRKSGLMRPKWIEQHGEQTYGEQTIATAISKGGPCYVARLAGDRRESCEAKERKAYSKCPLWWVVQLKGAGELAIRVLWIITSYADAKGEAFPSVERIALHARVSERRVKAAIAKLKALGILASTHRPRRSNLYQLAIRVPEAVTIDATGREALRVTEPGHLGCPSHGTVTNQELTIDKHRREEHAQVENQSASAEPDDSKRAADEKALSPPEACIRPARSDGAVRRKPSAYAGWDGTASTAKGRALLWDYAAEKLGLVGRVVFGSYVFRRPDEPIQLDLGG